MIWNRKFILLNWISLSKIQNINKNDYKNILFALPSFGIKEIMMVSIFTWVSFLLADTYQEKL